MQNISGIHAFEIKHFDRIVVPVKNALTSFIDAEDIGEITAKVLSEPDNHQNRGYSITGPEAMDYYEAAKVLSEELGRTITYPNPKPALAKKYWIEVRGLDKEYSTVMGMLYMMTRMGTAKKVTTVFEEIVGKSPRLSVISSGKIRLHGNSIDLFTTITSFSYIGNILDL